MAPKSRNPPDDSKSETASTKDKNGGNDHPKSTASKMRRVASLTGSQLKESTSASSLPSVPTTGAAAQAAAAPAGLQWSSFDRSVLHSYRRLYKLNTPTAFVHDYNRRILTQPGSIGLRSPTLARRRDSRRQSKEQLANTARKHFNGIGIQENDVIVDFLHKVRVQSQTKPIAPRIGRLAVDTEG